MIETEQETRHVQKLRNRKLELGYGMVFFKTSDLTEDFNNK